MQPILGLLMTNAHGDRMKLFLLADVPSLLARNHRLAVWLTELHRAVGFLLLGLIAMHASAALFHHFWRRDDTLDAMLPQHLRRRAVRTGASTDARHVVSRAAAADENLLVRGE
jgi:cytochrome b561